MSFLFCFVVFERECVRCFVGGKKKKLWRFSHIFSHTKKHYSPEEKSGEGIELLLRGFAEIAISGRELRASDYRNLRDAGIDGAALLCDTDPTPPGLVGPSCFGRVPKVVPFTRAPISFYVHEANPVKDMSAAQFERIAAAYRTGSGASAPTWGSVFPEADWAANPMLKAKTVDAFFSDVAGGQRGWVEKGTGVSLAGVPDSNDNDVAALFKTSDTGLAFRTNVVVRFFVVFFCCVVCVVLLMCPRETTKHHIQKKHHHTPPTTNSTARRRHSCASSTSTACPSPPPGTRSR